MHGPFIPLQLLRWRTPEFWDLWFLITGWGLTFTVDCVCVTSQRVSYGFGSVFSPGQSHVSSFMLLSVRVSSIGGI